MKTKLFTLLLVVAAGVGTGFASDTQVDGIWYDFDGSSKTASVTYRGSSYSSYSNEYTGSVVIPASVTYNAEVYSVTSIGEYAFADCTSLTSVTIPNSVTSIGSFAFGGCSGLTSVTIPNSVTSIGDDAFVYCRGLTSVTIGNSVTSIGESAFEWCSGLTSVTIGNSVTSIGDYAFYNCSSMTSVTIPNSVTSIGSFAFGGCSGLTSVTIGNSVISIGSYAFFSCTSLTSVTIESNSIMSKAHTSSSNLKNIFGSQVTEYIIGNSVTSIGEYAFADCTSLTSVTIPNSVTSIGSNAFLGCTGLTSVTIPNSVTSIGDNAFRNCSGLTSPVYNAHVFAYMPSFYSGAYTIPDGIESIAGGAFYGCTGLTSVTIPNSVTSLGKEAFYGCSSLTSVTINSTAIASKPYFSSSNIGTIFGSQVKEYIIGNSVTSIGDYAFYNCSSMTSVTIPNSVTSIKDHAFLGCSGLTSIEIPNSITSIGNYAFENCSGLTSVTIPNSVTSIGDRAISGCTGLTSVTIPNSVTSIGERAFQSCSGLTSVTIPNSVTSIGEWAFSDCTGLTSVTIPNSVTSIGRFAFYRCTSLTSPVYNAHVFAYMPSSYSGAYTIPDGIESIAGGAFYGCTGLTSVTIEAGTPPTIGEYCFYYNDYDYNNIPLNISVYVPCGTLDAYKNAAGWSDYASKIKYAPYPSYAVTKIAENGYISTTTTEFTICDEPFVECTANPNRGFYFAHWADGNTDNPRTIELTQDTTMEVIFDYLLTGKCGKDSALTWTFEPASMALNITGNGALTENYTYGTFIESLTIGNEITSIGQSAFYGCNNLKNVIIGSSVKVLEASAFFGCSSIEAITCYGQRPPTVNQNALYGLDYSTIVYVPADYLETYKMHDAWGLYDVRPLGEPVISHYTIRYLDHDAEVIKNELVELHFPQAPEIEGFTFVGWRPIASIIEENTIEIEAVYEAHEQSIPAEVNVPGNPARKLVREGNVYILHGERVYTIQGQEVK